MVRSRSYILWGEYPGIPLCAGIMLPKNGNLGTCFNSGVFVGVFENGQGFPDLDPGVFELDASEKHRKKHFRIRIP